MKNIIFIGVTLLLSACINLKTEKVEVKSEDSLKPSFYTSKVQPIFDNKCVACHSCYNSPCQLNLSSYEGVMRGANKISIYDFPKLEAREPTRLYVDAYTNKQWHKKGFYSVTDKEDNGKSILEYMISDLKGIETGLQEEYDSEFSRSCMRDLDSGSIEEYKALNIAGRMPFGLPRLKDEEVKTISTWLELGAEGPNTEKLESRIINLSHFKERIKKWEKLLNQEDMKSRLSSRFIYEHLFLANIYFKEFPNTFFRLTRSRTLDGPIREVSTTFPFDDPHGSFTYRFRPVTNTIMHKYHIPYELNEDKFTKWNKNFYQAKWDSIPKEMPAYGPDGANPFKTFQAIPFLHAINSFLMMPAIM